MGNSVGACTAYLSEPPSGLRTASHPFDHASPRLRRTPWRAPKKLSSVGFRHCADTPAQPPTMTNALHEVLTRGQNRPRNGGSSTEHLASCIVLGRTMPVSGILSRYCGFNLTISLMLRTGYNLGRCVRGGNPVSLGFVDSVRTIQLES